MGIRKFRIVYENAQALLVKSLDGLQSICSPMSAICLDRREGAYFVEHCVRQAT